MNERYGNDQKQKSGHSEQSGNDQKRKNGHSEKSGNDQNRKNGHSEQFLRAKMGAGNTPKARGTAG